MKSAILIVILVGFNFLSCQNKGNRLDTENEKIKIELNGLSDNHPSKKSMEWFLNNYKEEFIATKDEWKIIEHENLIQKRFSFHTKLSTVSLILIFCKNQQDALTIARANFPVIDGFQSNGVNGSILFVVKGNNQNEVNSVLQWFAGEE
jgi:hypothetical protein